MKEDNKILDMPDQFETPGGSNPNMVKNQPNDLPSVEKLYELYRDLHDKCTNLENENKSLKKEVSTLKNQQYRSALNVENIKECLRVFLDMDLENYDEAEATGIKKDLITKAKNELLKPAPELVQKVHGKNKQIENPSAIVTECLSPYSIDCDTVRTLLSIASQKKMVVKHFRKKWSNEIGACLEENQFKRSLTNPHLYFQSNGESAIYWTRYSDDFLLAAIDIKLMDKTADLLKKFDVEDLGILENFQDMEIRLNSDGIFCIKQSSYINNLLVEFGLKDAKLSGIPMNPGYLKARKNEQPMPSNTQYKNLIVSLSDLAMKTRPDIAVSVMVLSQFMEAPTESDWNEAKKIVRYLKGTVNCELRLGHNNQTVGFIGYADANWNSGQNSNTGYLFLFYGSPISWASLRQTKLVESSVDAECVALEEATRQGLRLQALVKDLNGTDNQIIMFEDNQRCLKRIDNQEFMSRMKENGTIVFQYCPSIDMIADMLTKPLKENKLRELSKKCGLLFLKDSQME